MKTLACVLLTLSCLSGCCARQSTAQAPERSDLVTLRGGPVTLVGFPQPVGEEAHDFVAVGKDMKDVKLSDFAGKTVIISSVPSVDTKVCAVQTRTFNEKAAALGEDVVILTISMDLPMAQSRFCAAEGIKQVVMLSDYKYGLFGKAWGLWIKESGLLARAVHVVDPSGKVVYSQIVPELTTEPDYDAALAAAKAARG